MTEAAVAYPGTQAPTASVAIVKGSTPAADWALVSLVGGVTREVGVQVITDLPHLVVESAFGIDDGRWGTVASGGDPGAQRPGHIVADAAVDAVVNRWRRGPDTPGGVRDRLRARAERETWLAARIACLARSLGDAEIRAARDGVQSACRQWAGLPVGGVMHFPGEQAAAGDGCRYPPGSTAARALPAAGGARRELAPAARAPDRSR